MSNAARTPLSIQAIAAHDWPRYRAIRLRALQDSPSAFGSSWAQEVAWPDEVWQTRTQTSATSPSSQGFFALQGDAVCGLVWCMLAEADPQTAHIYSMWVDPAARRHGAGQALLRQCISWAKGAGASQLRPAVTTGNSAVTRLYASQGFQPLGSAEAIHPGSPLMVQVMVLDLDASKHSAPAPLEP